jgi:NAD(P)-dependent dehydrogenase (short-subunit alcohol dehydrogenase family)
MTPSLPDVMMGHVAALSAPMPPEASGDYLVGRLGLVAMMSILAAQEAERGIDTRVWENGAIRTLLTRAASPANCSPAADLTWSALDRENAALRRALITVHIAAEEAGDAVLDRDILQLYKEMSDRRRLDLPPTP